MKLTLFHRGLILVGVPLLLEIVLIGSLSFLLYQSAEERLQETKYRKFSSEIARLMGLVSSAPFVLAASIQFQKDKLYQEYLNQIEEVHESTKTLEQILKKIPEIPRTDYEELDKSIEAVLDVTSSLAAERKNVGSINDIEKMESFQATLVKSKQTCYLHLEKMFDAGDSMTEKAQKRLDHTQHAQLVILNVGLVLNLIMALLLGVFFRLGILKRIRIIAKNTEAIARNEKLLPEIGGSDEIAQFDRAFHSMLEQLNSAAKNENDLFENASDVICVLDENYDFLRVNPASRKDWGFAPSELKGVNLEQVLPLVDGKIAMTAFEECRRTNAPASFEASIETKHKGKIVGLWSAFWAAEEKLMYCIVHDASEARNIEETRKRFLAMISSDLKIPLNRISAAFNKVNEELAEKITVQAKEKLSMAGKNIRRLLSLVNDLLAVSQMETGSFEINTERINGADLLKGAVEELEALAANKEISIVLNESCNELVLADQDRITQVLVNLLSNAIKFAPQKSAITVSNEIDRDSKGFVLFKVSDTGRGVPQSQLESIFEKFSQVEVSDGKRKSGTGLGLPICKQIVELHNGKIGVQSIEGQGSTFWFTLPLGSAPSTVTADQGGEEKDSASLEQATGRISDPKTGQSSLPARSQSRAEQKGIAAVLERLTLGQKGTLLVAIPVVVELLLVFILSNSLYKMEEERDKELHMRRMALTASKLSKYILYSSGSVVNTVEKFRWDRLKKSLHACKKLESDMFVLVEDDSYASQEYKKYWDSSEKLAQYTTKLIKQNLENSPEGVASMLQEKVKQLPSLLSVTRHLRNLIDHAEKFEFKSPEIEINERQLQFMLLYAALFLNIGFSILLAILFSVGVSRRILIMADNAARLVHEERLNPIIGGRDELSDLDRAFHQTARLLAESRKKERAIFDNSQDVLCILDPDGQFLSVNAAAESWGYLKKDLLSYRLDKIVERDDLSECKQVLLGEIDSESGKSHECRIRKRDGTVSYVLWSASRKSEQSNTYCIVRDISAKKALEELRKEFLAMVSHDLRTPLTAINGIAQLITAGVFGTVSDTTSAALQVVRNNVHSLLELISDILDLEKLDAGKMQLNLSKTTLDEILDGLVSECSELQPSFQIEVSAGDKNRGAFLSADRERLTHALASLAKFMILHQRQYTNQQSTNQAIPNGVREFTDGQAEDEQGNANLTANLTVTAIVKSEMLEISFLDSGPLFSTDQVKFMFKSAGNQDHKPAILAEHALHAELGLTLARKTIEAHGGRLELESHADNRNLIRVSFPISE